MKRIICYLFAGILISVTSFSQPQEPSQDTSWKKIYRETAPKINNLVHTKLDVRPDFSKSWLYGKAWLTLKPHFYPTDSLTLDAKGMEIKKLVLVKGNNQLPLKYEYDDLQLRIRLDKIYKANEPYTIFIDYIAKPNEFEEKHAKGDMLGIKGMYFINPRGEEKNKPTQIWTQGETESSSAWFPTIDKTNQKTTQELTVTVSNKYVTLSNGKLIGQKKNPDGTRSDTWKMDLPHSPYLFFLGVGDYAVVKDSWRGKEVSYYVEPEYGPVARKIFGNTPEMLSFFSKITGVDYPWVKYSQITGRDYVAGAMENTTATLHQEYAQQDARELVDGNHWESTIAHELFHHWFGDYVTTESWSNITVNESFADYSQTLWDEYKYGKDAGEAENYSGMRGYLQSGSENKHLVRFHYGDKEEVFDQVSYQKGGRILHMLRKHIGDSAFFAAMKLYLSSNKFKSAEAHHWRLAVEEVTGRDMNWYFNQWYFGSGHPNVTIDYKYDDAAGKVDVILNQTQKGKLFTLPLAIDIYNGTTKTRHHVWARNATDTFSFKYTKRPDLVNVDGEKIMLWVKKDNKTLDNYIHQYKYAGGFVDRLEALQFAGQHLDDPKAVELVKSVLKDKYHVLRSSALSVVNVEDEKMAKDFEPIIADIAKNDKKSTVRAVAIGKLGQYGKPDYANLFRDATRDSSYSVAGTALSALMSIDEATAMKIAFELDKKPSKGALKNAIVSAKASSGDESLVEEILGSFMNMPVSQAKFSALESVGVYLGALKNVEKVKMGVEDIVKFREAVPAQFRSQTDPYINETLGKILAKKEEALKSNPNDAALKGLVDYIKTTIPVGDKKGF